MKYLIFTIFSALVISSCSTPTDFTSSWKADNLQSKSYEEVVVMAMADDATTRRNLEQEMAQELSTEGIDATPAHQLFPEGFFDKNPDTTAIKNKLKDLDQGALLSISVLDVKENVRYVDTGVDYYDPTVAYPYYSYWTGYYGYWGPRVYDSGYLSSSTNVFLDSNLFDSSSNELVWSAQSKTYDPTSVSALADSYAEKLVDRMQSEGALDVTVS